MYGSLQSSGLWRRPRFRHISPGGSSGISPLLPCSIMARPLIGLLLLCLVLSPSWALHPSSLPLQPLKTVGAVGGAVECQLCIQQLVALVNILLNAILGKTISSCTELCEYTSLSSLDHLLHFIHVFDFYLFLVILIFISLFDLECICHMLPLPLSPFRFFSSWLLH